MNKFNSPHTRRSGQPNYRMKALLIHYEEANAKRLPVKPRHQKKLDSLFRIYEELKIPINHSKLGGNLGMLKEIRSLLVLVIDQQVLEHHLSNKNEWLVWSKLSTVEEKLEFLQKLEKYNA